MKRYAVFSTISREVSWHASREDVIAEAMALHLATWAFTCVVERTPVPTNKDRGLDVVVWWSPKNDETEA